MKILIRQVARFCRDHPVCWVPLLMGTAAAMVLNAAAKFGRHRILEWAGARQSVLGGQSSMPLTNPETMHRALFASGIFGTVMNLLLILVMTIAFVATARLAERVLEGEAPSAAEILRALAIQFRSIAWFSLQYGVCLFLVTLIGSLVFQLPDVARLFAFTFLNTRPPIWGLVLLEVMAVAYMLAVPAMRLVSPGESASRSRELEATARELGLWYAGSSAVLQWGWDLVRSNVRFAPAVSATAADCAASLVMSIPLLMLAVSFVMITAPAAEAEQTEMSPAT